MSQHGVNDLPTTELALDTLRLSKAQKHALYTLIADKVVGADEEQLLKSALEGTDYHKKMRYRNQLRAEQRKILKELFDA